LALLTPTTLAITHFDCFFWLWTHDLRHAPLRQAMRRFLNGIHLFGSTTVSLLAKHDVKRLQTKQMQLMEPDL
jgi:hypothetical protein